jgi:hypothetical protein
MSSTRSRKTSPARPIPAETRSFAALASETRQTAAGPTTNKLELGSRPPPTIANRC